MDITKYFEKGATREPPTDRREYSRLLTCAYRNGGITMDEYQFMIDGLKNGNNIMRIRRHRDIIDKVDNSELSKLDMVLHGGFYELMNGNKIVDDMNDIPYTDDQKAAIISIKDFLYSDRQTHGLYGYAGTGKTTLVSKLVIYLLRNKFVRSIILAAPTNKANNVLKSKFKSDMESLINTEYAATFNDVLDKLDDKGIKVNFLTIHKLLAFKNDFDMDGERIFVKSGRACLGLYDLIIIDECSMLSTQIMIHILEGIMDTMTKILFVGDPAQLPPINETKSVIFSMNDNDFDYDIFKNSINSEKGTNIDEVIIRQRFKKFKEAILGQEHNILKQVVRNSDNNVVSICNEVRHWVIGTKKSPVLYPHIGSKVYIYKNSGSKLESLWFKKYMEYAAEKNNVSNIIITWTNKQTDTYNQIIRMKLFDKPNIDKYEVGDTLILTDFYTIETGEGIKRKLYTSEQIRVLEVDNVTRSISGFTESFAIDKRYKNHADIVDKYMRCVTFINRNTVRKYDTLKMNVIKMSEDVDDISDTHYIIVLSDISKGILEGDKQLAGTKIKELRTYYRNMHKENMDTLDSDVIRSLWREWSRKFIEPFANVNYGNSITCHKAQGSNYHNVFVDIDDMLSNGKGDEARRCIYTSMTRPSGELHILI